MSHTNAPRTLTQALPSYLDPNHLGPWGIYLQQVDRVLSAVAMDYRDVSECRSKSPIRQGSTRRVGESKLEGG